MKRPALLVGALIAGGLGGAVLLLDLWVVIATRAAKYRLWHVHGRSELVHPWLWLGALPLTALLLIYGGYRLSRLRRHPGSTEPRASADSSIR